MRTAQLGRPIPDPEALVRKIIFFFKEMNVNQTDFPAGIIQPGIIQPGIIQPGISQPGISQPGMSSVGPVTVSTANSTRRRKSTKEQFQDALAIQNDYKNRNIVTDPDRDEDEFFCFIGKYPG